MPADVQWIAADGTTLDMDRFSAGNSAASGQHLAGKRGRFAPPVTAAYEPIAAANGRRLVNVRLDGREVTIPFAVAATSPSTLRTAVQAWAKALNPTLGDGILRVNDSTPARELVCRYTGGLEGSESWEDLGRYTYRGLLIFSSEDPYWRATTVDTVTFAYSSGAGVTWFPIFPLNLAAGAALAPSAVVSNDGDVDTWPAITVTGPFTSVTLRNNTSGRSVTIAATVNAGETLTVDFEPRTRSVIKGTSNLWASLTTREWWPLTPGVNDVVVTADNTTTATAATVAWRERFVSV